MRLLALAALAAIVLLALLGYLAVRDRATRRWARAEAEARWEDAHTAVDGVTLVVVRRVARTPDGAQRVLAESVVDRIPDDDPAWHDRFTAARQVAFDRAIDLNNRPLLG